MILHPKIQALRNSVGHIPIHYFYPTRSKYEALPLAQRAATTSSNDGDRLIKQYFCIFGIPDDYGTVPVKGCFAKSLNDRGVESKSSYKITVLNQHDQREPLCKPSVLIEDEIGLYGEYTPDEGIPSNDNLVKRVKNGTINNGSYGFNYIWDKMEYVEDTGLILMKEVDLFEVSPVTIGSQQETFVVRGANGEYIDKTLEYDTEYLLKQIPRQYHLEFRTIINRHISLAQQQPLETRQKALGEGKPKQVGIDFDYLLKKL